MSIRDLIRHSNTMSKYDYVEIQNKKSKKYHGLFIAPKYAKEMKAILNQKIIEEKQQKLNALNSFTGMLSGKVGEDRVGEIKSKYGK